MEWKGTLSLPRNWYNSTSLGFFHQLLRVLFDGRTLPRSAGDPGIERPVHQCPCPACQAGLGPDAEHHRRLNQILSRLDEQQRRWVAALEAQRLGYGGFNQVAAITGMHPETIRRGRDELAAALGGRPTDRVRLPGGGRPAAPKKIPNSSATSPFDRPSAISRITSRCRSVIVSESRSACMRRS